MWAALADGEKFAGHADRECGEHRTLGGRAWCFDCSEYCYSTIPCKGCELPALRSLLWRIYDRSNCGAGLEVGDPLRDELDALVEGWARG